MNAENLPLQASLVAAVLALAGCGGSDSRGPAESGNPEADRRAEARIGSEEERARGADNRTPEPLYDRLGGREAIVALVDDFAARAIADPRVNFERRNVRTNWVGKKYVAWEPTPQNVDRFKLHMIEFVSLAAGGPAEYTGRDMGAVHRGMRITNNEFDALVGDLKASMDRRGFARRETRDLLAVIETTRKEIVEKE